MSIRDLELETLSEMSMVDIVYHLLKESNKQPMAFHQILDEVMALKGLTDEQKMDVMSRVYTEINIDGRFKALGDNVWGLRSWYPVEQAEEIVITEVKKKSKKKRSDDEDDDIETDEEEADDFDEYDEEEEYDDEEDLDADDLEEVDEDLEDLDEDIEDLGEEIDEDDEDYEDEDEEYDDEEEIDE
ncbi:hypothetical protein GCM10008968_12190 [Bacillus horti]